MSDLSPNLSLPYLAPAQAQKHVTHNEALVLLDAVVQLAVQSRNQIEPPADPVPGARYIVPPGATGAWSGQEGMLTLWDGSAWHLLAPAPGWRARLLDEGGEVVWQDDAWQVPVTPLLGMRRLRPIDLTGSVFDVLPGFSFHVTGRRMTWPTTAKVSVAA
ncbi:DUF2793 domain-containing protein [Salipiger bermudensis]|uniref:DUF2793 domain-containing protein n=1 Tax=Salipiger bermudensis TaxID=344736 RepID=UPI0030080AC9